MKDIEVRPKAVYLLEQNIEETLYDIEIDNDSFVYSPKIIGSKCEYTQNGLHQTTKLLHSKEQNSRASGMEENMCKQYS
jgi:hypothetical protein